MFINKLYEAGIIDQPVFSLHLTKDHETSYMYFGGYDEDHVEDGTYINWMELMSTNYWQVLLSGAQIGSKMFIPSVSTAILDSGSSLIHLPAPDYKNVTDEIFATNTCSHDSQTDFVYCECNTVEDESFPNF